MESMAVVAAARGRNDMKVYVKTAQMGTISFDPENTPVAIVLDDGDKENIKNMAESANIYCVYSDKLDEDEIQDWLKEIKD